MPNILYYSTNCPVCNNLLSDLAKDKYENMLFFSVDSREVVDNKTYLILSNGSRVLLPVHVTCVPSLLLIDDTTQKNTLITGKEILKYFGETTDKQKEEDIELKPFVLGTKTGGIVSDSFSFLDTPADDLLANGNGGLKQLHNYTTLDEIHKIVTPPENYTPNTIGNDENNMDNLLKQRESEIKM